MPIPFRRPPAARWAAGAALLALAAAAAAPLGARDEVRALRVPGASLTSPDAVDQATAAAAENGFNTLLVQVRSRGDAYYLGSVEPRAASLAALPSFDPLAEVIAKGHARGLAVHAWIDVNLVSGTDVPIGRTHVVYRHPEWLMVPREIADDLAGLDPSGPEYLGRLMRYARARPAGVDGLYLSPATPAAVEYTTGIVRDIVTRYAVDGVYLDSLRYPSDEFDYSREALRAFGQSVVRAAARWRQFRADRLTALLTALGRAVKTARPSAEVSVAVGPDPAEAAAERFQDWSGWLNENLIDVVCPTAVTPDLTAFATEMAAARNAAAGHAIWAGIGAPRLSSEQAIDSVRAARRIGVGGVILSLSQLGKAAFSGTS